MTIKYERYTLSGLYTGEAKCNPPHHSPIGVRLLYIDHGVRPDAQPLDMGELDALREVAHLHDQKTEGKHDISIILFEK